MQRCGENNMRQKRGERKVRNVSKSKPRCKERRKCGVWDFNCPKAELQLLTERLNCFSQKVHSLLSFSVFFSLLACLLSTFAHWLCSWHGIRRSYYYTLLLLSIVSSPLLRAKTIERERERSRRTRRDKQEKYLLLMAVSSTHVRKCASDVNCRAEFETKVRWIRPHWQFDILSGILIWRIMLFIQLVIAEIILQIC